MTSEDQPNRQVPGWVIVDPDAVPDGWRARAVPMMLVPLTPKETDQLLAGEPVESAILADDLPLVRHIARGHTAAEIARALNLSTRTVYRRVTRLRHEFAVPTMEELATELARRGF